MRLILFSISSILLLAVTLTAKEPNRTWTSADGKSLQAKYISSSSDKVTIKMGSREYTLPLSRFSPADQQYVASLTSKPTPAITKSERTDVEPVPMANLVIKTASNIELIWCPPGSYLSNSRSVSISKGFYLGKYEVTQTQYKKVMNSNPSYFIGKSLPVERVSWYDAMKFCATLTQIVQNESDNDFITNDNWEFTLPTVEQWEYACRAGTNTDYSWGSSITRSKANYSNANPQSWSNKTKKVGSYRANPWGFHDMHGNVQEWTINGILENKRKCALGGSANHHKSNLRSGFYLSWEPKTTLWYLGFRVALSPKKDSYRSLTTPPQPQSR